MALIVNGVCRFTVEQRFQNNEVANIIDMRIDTTGSTGSREDAINDQAEVIFGNWAQYLLNQQVGAIQLDAVRWVDLDQADGSTGSVTSGETYTAPSPGRNPAAPLPSNVAVLVKKALESSGRGRRAGRMYICGFTEPATGTTTPNVISPTDLTSLQGDLTSFLGAINQNGTNLYDYQSAMCVVHVTSRDSSGAPLTGTSSDVGALEAQNLLATQRRRLRR